MEGNGVVRLTLDPRAQEFRPRHHPLPLPLPPPPAAPYFVPPPPPQPLFYPFAAAPGYLSLPYPAAPQPPAIAAPGALPPPPPNATATRAVVLAPVPADATEAALRRDMEVFGDVRAVQMERLALDGSVTVHFYDLRDARRALREVRDQHMLRQQQQQQQCLLRDHHRYGCAVGSVELRLPYPAPGLVAGRAVWAQFTVPVASAIPDGQNQGTVVVFNLDPDVSPAALRRIFEAFGPVKELRDTPFKKHQRFIEFYDVRDAARALCEMNGKEIHGKSVVIEFSRPGGYSRKFLNSGDGPYALPSKAQALQPPVPPSPLSLPSPMPVPQPMLFAPSAVHQLPRADVVPIAASMCGLTLSGEAESEEADLKAHSPEPGLKRTDSGKNKKHGKVAITTKQPNVRSSKPWKTRHSRKLDSRFVISNEAIGDASNSADSRTTVMIKNIPNKYSQKLLLNMLDAHCINCNEKIGDEDSPDQPYSAYDFVYLPIDFNNKCNVGYGFVNMTTPQATLRLYKAFHLRHWEVFNSRKICEITYARIQGLEALKEHFKNSKFPCEMDHYLPVVFTPPRDGLLLTEPVPVIGQGFLNQRCHPSDDGSTSGDILENGHDDDDDNDSSDEVEA